MSRVQGHWEVANWDNEKASLGKRVRSSARAGAPSLLPLTPRPFEGPPADLVLSSRPGRDRAGQGGASFMGFSLFCPETGAHRGKMKVAPC